MKKISFFLITMLVFGLLSILIINSSDSSNLMGQKSSSVYGFGFLKRIPGQWNGPVITTTPAGNFPAWYVDFRPVSPGQVSQYSIVNDHTLNYLSFFIVKHKGKLKVAMRTEGVFKKKGCVTYEVMDKVNESEGYYRFSDFNAGDNRAYTEFRFKKNTFVMKTYTNKFNKVSPLELHTKWTAKRGSSHAAVPAIKHFKYPQPVMVKDFTNAFKNMSESIFYTFKRDPYPSASQPYVGKVTVYIKVDKSLKVRPSHELFLLLTTKSLLDGATYNKDNLKYISKFAYLPPGTKKFTFKHVHPGKYYLYSYNDINGDKKHKSGDYMSSNFYHSFTLPQKGNIRLKTTIDFVIP